MVRLVLCKPRSCCGEGRRLVFAGRGGVRASCLPLLCHASAFPSFGTDLYREGYLDLALCETQV